MDTLRRKFGPSFQGLWRNPEFMKLWMSLTITSFGAQVTNLALPLTAAVLLQATPWQMGVLVALETLPFALVSLHAGVLIDRVRKLPIVIIADATDTPKTMYAAMGFRPVAVVRKYTRRRDRAGDAD